MTRFQHTFPNSPQKEEARRLNVSVVEYSQAENARIDPEEVLGVNRLLSQVDPPV